MNKKDYFLAALKAGAYKKKAWVISCFSLIREDYSTWKQNPYPYRLVQTPTGHFFVDPNNAEILVPLDDAVAGQPPFTFKERISLKSGDVANLKDDIESSIGNLFFNHSCLVHAFGTKIPYVQGQVSARNLEDQIAKRLADTPALNNYPVAEVPDPATLSDSSKIYVNEYLKFNDALFFLTNYTQLCVWAATEKILIAPPGIKELKAKLLEENKDRLHDPAVISKIETELVKHDAEFLKGDPGENFLNSSKLRNTVRKKMFLMTGGEAALGNGQNMDLIQNSLEEGWQIEKFSAMNNSSRSGSYNRGAETRLGGEAVKWLLRASSNINVTVDDCQTRLGKVLVVDNDNIKQVIGYNLVSEQGYLPIETKEEAGAYLGKKVMVRSPMYCKLEKTDYCKACVGPRLAQNPNAVSMAVSEYGSKFMGIFMAAMHAKALLTAHMNYKKAIF